MLGDKYQIFSIMDMARKRLSQSLAPSNAVQATRLAILHGETDLLEEAMQVLRCNLKEVQATEAWETLEEKIKVTLLTRLLTMEP